MNVCERKKIGRQDGMVFHASTTRIDSVQCDWRHAKKGPTIE